MQSAIGADLSGADLRVADLIGVAFRDADLTGADLTGSFFLTQSQLDATKADGQTKLPLTQPPGALVGYRHAGGTHRQPPLEVR